MTGTAHSEPPPVLLDIDGGVALLTLNRPDRLNAWTADLGEAYFDCLALVAGDPRVRAVVVTGAGRGFCAGADMQGLEAASDAGSAVESTRPMTFPLTIPKPIIAAINGPCAGVGLVQALMCDVRFAAAGAKLTTSFSKLGLVAEHGISWLLAKQVGLGHALDLLMSSRVVLAEEAVEMGLVKQVCRPDEVVADAVAYAGSLATGASPRAMATIKMQVYEHYLQDLSVALRNSDEVMRESLQWPDFSEGVASFVEKRPPSFPDLVWSGA